MDPASHGGDNLERAHQCHREFCLWGGLILAVAAGGLTGCVTKAKANAQAREAFLAGQQQAAQMFQGRGPNVRVVGQVRNGLLPWTMDLTLARAVVAADYFGARDPTEITIIRDGEIIRVDPDRLLGGDDVLLHPRDIVELK